MIRRATQQDADAIGRLWEGLVAYHNALDDSLPPAAPEGWQVYAERIRSRIYDPKTCVLVVEVNGVVVGYVLGVVVDVVPDMFIQRDTGFLADIFIEEAHRRAGYGRALVNRLIEWFGEQGVESFEWHVAARNTDGRAFWEAVGGRAVMIRMRVDVSDED